MHAEATDLVKKHVGNLRLFFQPYTHQESVRRNKRRLVGVSRTAPTMEI
jgi:hypothetical protein